MTSAGCHKIGAHWLLSDSHQSAARFPFFNVKVDLGVNIFGHQAGSRCARTQKNSEPSPLDRCRWRRGKVMGIPTRIELRWSKYFQRPLPVRHSVTDYCEPNDRILRDTYCLNPAFRRTGIKKRFKCLPIGGPSWVNGLLRSLQIHCASLEQSTHELRSQGGVFKSRFQE